MFAYYSCKINPQVIGSSGGTLTSAILNCASNCRRIWVQVCSQNPAYAQATVTVEIYKNLTKVGTGTIIIPQGKKYGKSNYIEFSGRPYEINDDLWYKIIYPQMYSSWGVVCADCLIEEEFNAIVMNADDKLINCPNYETYYIGTIITTPTEPFKLSNHTVSLHCNNNFNIGGIRLDLYMNGDIINSVTLPHQATKVAEIIFNRDIQIDRTDYFRYVATLPAKSGGYGQIWLGGMHRFGNYLVQ